MKRILSVLMVCSVLAAQTAVNQSAGGPPRAYVTLNEWSGGYLIYSGVAEQPKSANSWLKRSDSTLTNIIDAANVSTVTCATACGVWVGQRVTVSGATVDTDLNGTYTVTATATSTTFTFTTASVTDATYTDATMIITTSNPLTTAAVWTITALKYNGSNELISVYYANSCSAAQGGGCVAWSNRATY